MSFHAMCIHSFMCPSGQQTDRMHSWVQLGQHVCLIASTDCTLLQHDRLPRDVTDEEAYHQRHCSTKKKKGESACGARSL